MLERQIYRIAKTGSIRDLRLNKQVLPAPGQNEVTVQVKATGHNFADVFAMPGLYQAAPKTDFIPGLEFGG